jgi:hypothetical protein
MTTESTRNVNQSNRRAAGIRMQYTVPGSARDRKYLPVLSSRIMTESVIRRFATIVESRTGTDPPSRYRKYPQEVTSRESIHVLNPSWVFWDLQKIKSISVRMTLTRKRIRNRVLISGVHMVSRSAPVLPRQTVRRGNEWGIFSF